MVDVACGRNKPRDEDLGTRIRVGQESRPGEKGYPPIARLGNSTPDRALQGSWRGFHLISDRDIIIIG
jgi:hypothetical protein